jgi:hypothetical protein
VALSTRSSWSLVEGFDVANPAAGSAPIGQPMASCAAHAVVLPPVREPTSPPHQRQPARIGTGGSKRIRIERPNGFRRSWMVFMIRAQSPVRPAWMDGTGGDENVLFRTVRGIQWSAAVIANQWPVGGTIASFARTAHSLADLAGWRFGMV